MRRYAFSLFLCGVVVCGEKSAAATDSLSAFSPQAEEQVKEVPNPEQAARKLTDEMDELLQLTEKQYKKIYKLNQKEEKEKVERMTGKAPFGGERPPMPPMGGGMPPQNGSFERGGMRPPMTEDMQEDMQSRMEKRNKKLKKILTDEQYEKWMSRIPEPEEPAAPFPMMPEE